LPTFRLKGTIAAMNAGKWAVLAVGIVALLFVWLLFREGLFDSRQALDDRAASLDAGVLEQWPFVDGGIEDAGTPDAGVSPAEQPAGPSLGLSGTARLALDHFGAVDKQKRHVLRVKHLNVTMDMDAMRHGAIHVPHGRIEGAEITLYRDKSGKMTIASAFRPGAAPPPPPSEPSDEETEELGWAIQVGPMILKDVILTLGFTANPVKFRVDHGTMHVRKGGEDSGPMIYFDHIEGAMLEPSPLPHPVRIAHAKGVVRLKGHPMVDMVARTCLGTSELRLRAVVPTRKKPVELTGDSAGAGGLLGRMALLITSKAKAEKVHYTHGAVKLEGGPGCHEAPTHAPQPEDGGVQPPAVNDAGVSPP
jgi:hypothetical protein